uniref:Period circadian protein n=1 Tax=Anopheles farauti TaxID=69004 RepID=A0A182QGN9_9DIPT
MSTTGMETLEGAESTHNTKVSDSAYSNSCSNSQSQRSGSSKSRHSGSNSSGSSGYGGKASTQTSSIAPLPQPAVKRSKDKDRKKKKLKTSAENVVPNGPNGSSAGGTTTGTVATSGNTATIVGPHAPATDQTNLAGCGESVAVEQTVASATGGATIAAGENGTGGGGTQAQSGHEAEPNNLHEMDVVGGTGNGSNGGTELVSVGVAAAAAVAAQLISEEKANEECTRMSQELLHRADENVQKKRVAHSILPGPAPLPAGVASIVNSIAAGGGGNELKDMWLGRSFIDFVHPKDRATFASQITSKVVVPLGESKSGQKDHKNSLYVMLRKYRGLKTTGFSVTSTSVNYEPYRLVLTFREAPAENAEIMSGRSILLIISATPVKSVYREPNESLCERDLKFNTRHTTSGVLSYVDGSSVESIGYLPQDILGRSIMELYHPDDMPILRKAYETVMVKGQTAGASFVSQPYRFLVNNGCYIVLSTEWTSFVNPWSRELEFVIGNHRILQGPAVADVFVPPFYCQNQFSDDALKEAKIVEEQILRLLKEPVAKPSDMVKQEVSKRCKALASFMEELMDEVTQPELKLNLLNESDFTFSERDSVMLGEISPHHEYFDSKSSSETPPSYNQLNYNENLQRFFDSRPAMNIEEQLKMDSSGGTNTETLGDEQQSHVVTPNQRGFSASGGGGSGGSAGNFSSESNAQMDSTTNTTSNTGGTGGTGTSSGGGGGGSFQPPTLTEELLCKHNEDMQKVMLKKHREARMVARGTDKNKKGPPDKGGYGGVGPVGHGVKRGSSHSWEGDAHKTIKHQHNPDPTGGVGTSAQLQQHQQQQQKMGPVAPHVLQQQLLIEQQHQQQQQLQQQQQQQQQLCQTSFPQQHQQAQQRLQIHDHQQQAGLQMQYKSQQQQHHGTLLAHGYQPTGTLPNVAPSGQVQQQHQQQQYPESQQAASHQHQPYHQYNQSNGTAGGPSYLAESAVAAAAAVTHRASSFNTTLTTPSILTPQMTYGTHTGGMTADRAGDLWPPFSVSVTTMQASAGTGTGTANFVPSHSIFPTLYYIPAAAAAAAAAAGAAAGSPQPAPVAATLEALPRLNPITVPYMAAGVMYPHPQLYQQSLLYPPMMYHAMPYQPLPPPCGLDTDTRNSGASQTSGIPGGTTTNGNHGPSNGGKMAAHITVPPSAGSGSQSQTTFQRPSSQATSVKAEPGSAMGSIASASIVANRAFSESSKKDLTDSPLISNIDCTDCALDEVLDKHCGATGAEGRSRRVGSGVGGPGGGGGGGGRGNDSRQLEKLPRGLDANSGRGAVDMCEVSDDMDESSFSSFYSSFLKTDNSSEGQNGAEGRKESSEMCWESGSNNATTTNNRMHGEEVSGGGGGGSAGQDPHEQAKGKGGSGDGVGTMVRPGDIGGGSRAKRRPNPPWLDNVCQTKDLIYRYQINERSLKELLDSDNLALKKISQPILVNDQLGQLYLDLELEGLSAKLSLSEATSGSSSDDCDTKDKAKVNKRNMKYSKLVMIYEENAPFPPPNESEP